MILRLEFCDQLRFRPFLKKQYQILEKQYHFIKQALLKKNRSHFKNREVSHFIMTDNSHITHFVPEKGEIKVGYEIQKEVLHFKKTGIIFQKNWYHISKNRHHISK